MNDPDEIFLTKSQIFIILDNVEAEYQRNPSKHSRSIEMIGLLRLFLNDYSDDELKKMCMLIIKFIDFLRYENAKHTPMLKTLNSFKGQKSTQLMVSEIFG